MVGYSFFSEAICVASYFVGFIFDEWGCFGFEEEAPYCGIFGIYVLLAGDFLLAVDNGIVTVYIW